MAPAAVTAKVRVNTKSASGEGANAQAYLSIGPDYNDGRNAEWAAATPALSLSMTVNGGVGDFFEQGAKYTLTFTRDEEADVDASADIDEG